MTVCVCVCVYAKGRIEALQILIFFLYKLLQKGQLPRSQATGVPAKMASTN